MAQATAPMLDSIMAGAGPAAAADRRFSLPYHLVGPTVFAIDLVLMVGTSVLSGVGYTWVVFGHIPSVNGFLATGVLAFSNFSAILAAGGDYKTQSLVSFGRQARSGIVAWTGISLLLVSAAFLLKVSSDFSRGAAIIFFTFGLASFLAWRLSLARLLREALSRSAFAARKIIVVGQQERLASSRAIKELERCGYNAIRTFEITDRDIACPGTTTTLRRTLGEVLEAARCEGVQDIFLLVQWQYDHCIKEVIEFLKVLPIPVHLLPDENVAHYFSHRTVPIGNTWAVELKRAPLKWTEQALKRSADAVAAAAALLMVSPLVLLTALLIKLDSSGPILFTQMRNGFNGRSFRIFKFRTMTVLEDGPRIQQATRNDSRVTRLGRVLRQTSIDELPQLFNVLRGDMSLVGPRPHAAAHNMQYEQVIEKYAFRYHVKPGITGWAQVNGYRGETQTLEKMERRVQFDLWYINNWSIWLDLKILSRTLWLVLRQQPFAY